MLTSGTDVDIRHRWAAVTLCPPQTAAEPMEGSRETQEQAWNPHI